MPFLADPSPASRLPGRLLPYRVSRRCWHPPRRTSLRASLPQARPLHAKMEGSVRAEGREEQQYGSEEGDLISKSGDTIQKWRYDSEIAV